MTSFDKTANMPAAVNTESKLLAFAVLAIYRIYGGKAYNEVEGQPPSPVVTASIVRADDGTQRLIGRYSLPLVTGWDTDTANQLWALVQELGTVDWPVDFNP